MTNDVMLTLGAVALLTLFIVGLGMAWSRLKGDLERLSDDVAKLRSGHGQQLRRHDASIDTLFAQSEAHTDALFEHEAKPHPKPPARKQAAKKAPAKKAAPRKAPAKRRPPVSAR